MLRPDRHRYRFPWREGNRFELLVDGERFFPSMLEAVETARERVLLELYLFESGGIADRFIDAFTAAAGRGVTVCLLLDDYGTGRLGNRDRARLDAGGVRLSFYNPLHYMHLQHNLFRDHRKLLVVDGRVAYVGGAGITDEFAGNRRGYWHDSILRIEGPCVGDWEALFLHTWGRWGKGELALPEPKYQSDPEGRPGRVVVSGDANPSEVKRSLLKRIRASERRVWLATAYFIPSWKIRRALRQAARSGIDVRLLLPGPRTDHPAVRYVSRRFYGRLLRNGVRIFEYQPRFLHAKLLLCDEWVSAGSSNLDRWNLRWNLEANQEVTGEELSEQVEEQFRRDFAQSREWLYDDWRRRPWLGRFQEWFWGWVDLMLERWGQGRGNRR